MRAVVVALLAACNSTSMYVRQVKIMEPPAKVREQISARAAVAGWVHVATNDDTDRYTAAMGPIGDRWIDVGKQRQGVTVRTAADGDGTLVELEGPSPRLFDTVAKGGDTFRSKDSKWLYDPFYFNLAIDAGYAKSHHTDVPIRVDTTAQFGWRFWARGGDRETTEPRRRFSLVGGLGLAVDDRPAIRPEVSLVFDSQDARTINGRRILASHRKSASLSLALLAGSGYSATELGATVHLPPYGGVFVRGGYERGERSGMTYMAGFRFDTLSAATLLVVGLAAAIAYGIKTTDFDLDLDVGCNKNYDC